jgi:hypothetical protein
MCIEHIINLVRHQVEEASNDQSHRLAKGQRKRPISGADRLTV